MARHRHAPPTAASPTSASTTSGAAPYDSQDYNQVKAFVITDRPVYRPEQNVEFKVWIRRATYDEEDSSQFAHQSFHVEIHNPKGEKVYTETLTADNYGGIAGKFELPADATLGQYYLQVVNHGGGSFRVEEYKKPEFEVTVDAPKEPVQLGEKITATIRAKYYFGSPVTDATVKYKVLRTEHASVWYPADAVGLALRPRLLVVLVRLHLVSRLARVGLRAARAVVVLASHAARRRSSPSAKRRSAPTARSRSRSTRRSPWRSHPDQDHRYSIQAEVVDQSRRTIVGSGEVLVAREPFHVFAWVDRGYYRVGDTINASFAARRLDGQRRRRHRQAAAAEDQLRRQSRRQADRDRSPHLGPHHRRRRPAPRSRSKPPSRASTASPTR